MIGKIERVKLRDVWPHEALDFTRWLEEHLDLLNEILDLNLTSAEREKEAGDFSVDLVAEDTEGNPVVIENQLEKSNHDHLGKIITYLTAVDAKTAIWIVSEARPEHIAAVTWLNQSNLAAFYLLKAEAIRIIGGDVESLPAPLLTLIVGPSEEGRRIGEAKKEIAERDDLRRQFWTGLLNHAKTKTKLFATIAPSQYNWISTGAGTRGLAYAYSLTQHTGTVSLIVDRGKGAELENKSIFAQLEASKPDIEKAFGEPLEWECIDTRRFVSIKKGIKVGGYRDDKNTWPGIFGAMVDTMIKLEKVLQPYLDKLKI